jgi:hypothetical protein
MELKVRANETISQSIESMALIDQQLWWRHVEGRTAELPTLRQRDDVCD